MVALDVVWSSVAPLDYVVARWGGEADIVCMRMTSCKCTSCLDANGRTELAQAIREALTEHANATLNNDTVGVELWAEELSRLRESE